MPFFSNEEIRTAPENYVPAKVLELSRENVLINSLASSRKVAYGVKKAVGSERPQDPT